MDSETNTMELKSKCAKKEERPLHFLDYVQSSEFDLEQVCRICLLTATDLVKMFAADSSDLSHVFRSFTSIEVIPNETMPQQICISCREELLNCNSFKKKCLWSDSTLKTVLQGDYIKNEPQEVKCNTLLGDDKENLCDAMQMDDMDFVEVSDTLDMKLEKADIIKDKDCKSEFDHQSDTHSTQKYGKDKPGNRKRSKIKKKKTHKNPDTNADMIRCSDEVKEKVPYRCDICSEIFEKRKSLEVHVASHGSAPGLPCAHCANTFKSERDLALHSTLHSTVGHWECVECHKKFDVKHRYRRHIERHMQHKRHTCGACHKTFSEHYALLRHARTHTGQVQGKMHACHVCNKRFSSAAARREHGAHAHGGARPCVCARCGKRFASRRLLASHALVHTDLKPYKCAYCDTRFRHESTRTAHQRTHTGERPYVCAACGKAFLQNSNLTLHMRTHTGEKPYSCESCGRKFSTGSALKNHAQTHNNVHVTCKICGKSVSGTSIRSHSRRHAARRVLACSLCGKQYRAPAALRTHLLLHTGEKPFECEICHKKYTTKQLLAKHIKSHEKDKDRANRPMLLVHRVTDDTPYCAEEVIISQNDVIDEGINLVENQAVLVDVSQGIPIQMQALDDDDLPAHVCLTQTGMKFVTDVQENLVAVTHNEIMETTSVDEATSIRLYQVDQSLLQIQSVAGQLTISKITSKVTANFE